MAYAFNNLFNLINGTAENQSNVFGQNAAQEGQGQPGMAGQPTVQGGEAIGTGQGGVSSQAAPKGAGSGATLGDATQVRAEFARRNVPKTPQFVGKFQGDIAEAGKKAQTEANRWAASQTYDSDVDEAEKQATRKAISSGDFSGISAMLQPGAATARDFSYSDEGDFTGRAKALETRSGAAEELQRGAAGMYGTGRRAKVDADLLLGSKEYMGGVKEAQRQADDLLKRRGELERGFEQATIAKQEQANAAQKQALVDYLNRRQAAMGEALGERASAAKTGLKNTLKAGGGDWTNEQAAAIQKDLAGDPRLRKLQDELGAIYGGRYGDYELQGISPSSYFGISDSNVGIGEVASDAERQQWSNINKLLGLGGAKITRSDLASKDFNAAKRYKFDEKSYRSGLEGQAQKLSDFKDLEAQIADLDAQIEAEGMERGAQGVYEVGDRPQTDAEIAKAKLVKERLKLGDSLFKKGWIGSEKSPDLSKPLPDSRYAEDVEAIGKPSEASSGGGGKKKGGLAGVIQKGERAAGEAANKAATAEKKEQKKNRKVAESKARG